MAYSSERYRRYKEAGLCGCSRPLAPGKKLCQTCLDNNKKYRSTARGALVGKAKVAAYYQKNKVQLNNKKVAKREQAKIQVMLHYGGKCACCGEDGLPFLAIDHIRGDGAEKRRNKEHSHGNSFYKWIIDNNFPSDLQVLCHSCNFAKKTADQCPHQTGDVVRLCARERAA